MQDQTVAGDFIVFPDWAFAAPAQNTPEDSIKIIGSNTGGNITIGGTIPTFYDQGGQ